MNNYAVIKDEDGRLIIVSKERLDRDVEVVFAGNLKACRIYVARHQQE